MPFTFLYTKREHLAKRSQNLIDEIGGIEKLLDFYRIHGSFLNVQNSGRYTNGQLCVFCEYLLSNNNNVSVVQIEEEKAFNELEETVFVYNKEKRCLSVRVNNVLKKLELQFDFDLNEENKLKYFNKYFFGSFDFMTLQNLGSKSRLELYSLKTKLVIKPSEESVYAAEINKEKCEQENKILSFILTAGEKELFLVHGKFDFKKLLCIFIFSSPIVKVKYHELVHNNYFTEIPLSNKDFAKTVQFSSERLRQLEIIFKDTIIPKSINELYELGYCDLKEILESTASELLILDDFEHFMFRDIRFTPNKEFSKIVYEKIYTNYTSINKLLKDHFKSFEIPNINLFILKTFIEKTQLIKLLEWADEQIYSFEIISFEYNLEILIQRYFSEYDVSIDKGDLKTLYLILSKIKKDIIEVNIRVRRRMENKKYKEDIVNKVYSFLKDKNEGQSTKSMLKHLNESNTEIKKSDLLKFLHTSSSTFSFLGMGNWNLTEWNRSNGQTRGNFMQLIKNLLHDKNEPLHISELYDYINTMKKVSINSLSSNLKLETKGPFRFFNCSFVGLAEKQYDKSWDEIPKFSPVYVTKHSINRYKNSIEAVRDISKKYGYPEKHLEYILDCKDGKYN